MSLLQAPPALSGSTFLPLLLLADHTLVGPTHTSAKADGHGFAEVLSQPA
jgi:hypothetical protein